MANTFNNYFSETVVNKGVEKVIDDYFGDDSTIKLITERGNKLCFHFNTVSKSYMKGILDKLNPQKAVSGDSTPSSFYAYQLVP